LGREIRSDYGDFAFRGLSAGCHVCCTSGWMMFAQLFQTEMAVFAR